MISAAEIGRPPGMSASLFNEVVASAELSEVRLVSSSFSVQPSYFNEKKSDKFEFSLNSGAEEPFFDQDSKVLFVAFDYSVLVKSDAEIVLECKARYIVLFDITKNFEFDTMAYFARKVGSNISYPYFREFVSGQSWASGANLPILPLMKIGPGEPVKSPERSEAPKLG